MAELWGSVVVSLLFWGFANQVRPRFHPPPIPTPLLHTRDLFPVDRGAGGQTYPPSPPPPTIYRSHTLYPQ
eukprot:scaffold16566_cov67-Isochrysis_galbana.AAC.1